MKSEKSSLSYCTHFTTYQQLTKLSSCLPTAHEIGGTGRCGSARWLLRYCTSTLRYCCLFPILCAQSSLPTKVSFCAQLTGRQDDKRLAAISPLIADIHLLVVPGSHRELKDLARLHGWSDEAQRYINSTKGRVESMLLFRV